MKTSENIKKAGVYEIVVGKRAARDLAPTRAPHHPAPPRATTFWETTPPPGNGAVDTRAGWWARRFVVARGWVGGGWALVGARPHDTPLDLAPTRAPHHPAPPRATTFRETTPPPGNGAVDTRVGWWARRHLASSLGERSSTGMGGWVDGPLWVPGHAPLNAYLLPRQGTLSGLHG